MLPLRIQTHRNTALGTAKWLDCQSHNRAMDPIPGCRPTHLQMHYKKNIQLRKSERICGIAKFTTHKYFHNICDWQNSKGMHRKNRDPTPDKKLVATLICKACATRNPVLDNTESSSKLSEKTSAGSPPHPPAFLPGTPMTTASGLRRCGYSSSARSRQSMACSRRSQSSTKAMRTSSRPRPGVA